MTNLCKLELRVTTFVALTLIAIPSVSAQITHSFTEPIEKRDVASAQADVIAKMLIQEGSEVVANDILAELDNNVLKQSLRMAELRANSTSGIKSAEAAIRTRQSRYEKLVPLLENGQANPAEVENAKAEFDAALADLQLANEKKQETEIEVERIRAEIDRRIIRSPITGVVTQIHCRPGEFIASNERQFATVVRLDELRVRFYLLDETASQLAKGQAAKLLLGPSKTEITGTIEFVSPVTDPDSNTCRVDVVIDNRLGQYRSGTACVWNGAGRSNPAVVTSRTNQKAD